MLAVEGDSPAANGDARLALAPAFRHVRDSESLTPTF
jgi:hypothetical protein